MIWPISKDAIVSFGNLSTPTFFIYVNSALIYTGVSKKRPGQTENTIYINDIVADYLKRSLPNLVWDETREGAAFDNDVIETNAQISCPEVIVTYTDAEGTQVEAFRARIFPDWSYTEREYTQNKQATLSDPIVNLIDPRQRLIATLYNGNMASNTWKFHRVNLGDFDEDFDYDFNKVAEEDYNFGSGFSTLFDAVFPLHNALGIGETVKISSNAFSSDVELEYIIKKTCHRYAFYYLNAFGGWDTMLMQGAGKERDSLTRYEIKTPYNNNSIGDSPALVSPAFKYYERGRHNYLNEVQKAWEVNTGFLTDEQSRKMHHLLESTNVYLHDLEENKVYPVTITDNEVEYKTFTGEDCKMANYLIKAQFAQDRQRR